MKSLLILVVLSWNFFLPNSAFGQSSFQLLNYDPFNGINAPVFDAQGVPLAGSNYAAELWGSATSNSLSPLMKISQGSGREIVPFLSGGYFFSSSGFLCVTTVPPRGWAWLRVRAWDTRLGATYEDATALGRGGYGESPLFYARGRDPLLALPELPAPLIGLQSFSLLPVVPEPSIWALFVLGGTVVLGGIVVWWAARRRRSRGHLWVHSTAIWSRSAATRRPY